MTSITKVGVYVDVENIRRNGGHGMQYGVLRKFACRDGAEPVRLNAYVGFDRHRANQDARYERSSRNFFSTIRDFGYKVIEKEVKWYKDDEGVWYGKANADLDMAVDALLQSENLDRVLLVTGDGDFIRVVRALQNKGCRVEVIAFENISSDLRRETDLFISGYLVPDLLPNMDNQKQTAWGEIGSRVRGTCYYYNHMDNFGFMRYLKQIGPLWITDYRDDSSPYRSVYFNYSQLSNELIVDDLPSRNRIFEFTLAESERFEGEFQAKNIDLVCQQ